MISKILLFILCLTILNLGLFFCIPATYFKSGDYIAWEQQYQDKKINDWNYKYKKYYFVGDNLSELNKSELYFNNRIQSGVDTEVQLLKSFFDTQDKKIPIRDRANSARYMTWKTQDVQHNLNYVSCVVGISCYFTGYLSRYNDLDYLSDAFEGKHIKKIDEELGPKPAMMDFSGEKYHIPSWYKYVIIGCNAISLLIIAFFFLLGKIKQIIARKKPILQFDSNEAGPFRSRICPTCGK